MAGEHGRGPDYRTARIGAATALVAVVVALMLGELLVPTYQTDAVELAALLGSILALLGIEAARVYRGGRDE